MYDVSKEFRKFYKNYVVLQSEKQQNLRDKKDLNIKFGAHTTLKTNHAPQAYQPTRPEPRRMRGRVGALRIFRI